MNSPTDVGADLACRRTLDHVATPILVRVPHRGVVYVNRAWCDLTGTTPDDNRGDGWLRAIDDADRAGVELALSGAEDASAAGPRDYRVHGRDGQVIAVKDQASLWIDETTQQVVGVVHTLTPHADEVRGKSMAKWAHELRGPLNAILGWSDLLSAGDSAADVVQRGLRAIASNARQQAQLIKRMSE